MENEERITIECQCCNWAFDNVPWNNTAERITAGHRAKYTHKVIVKGYRA